MVYWTFPWRNFREKGDLLIYRNHLRILMKQATVTLFRWPQCSILFMITLERDVSKHVWNTCITLVLLIMTDKTALPWEAPNSWQVFNLDLDDNVVHIAWTLRSYLKYHYYSVDFFVLSTLGHHPPRCVEIDCADNLIMMYVHYL